MRKLLILLPAMMLVACGQFANKQAPVTEVIADLNQGGYLSEEDQDTAANLDDGNGTLEEVNVTENIAQGDNIMIMDIKGQKATVEYMNDPEIAFKINGLEVTHEVAQNPKLLDGLLEGLVKVGLDQLINGLIGGLPADVSALIQAGLQIINNGNIEASLGEILGVVVRGFFNVFMQTIPFGNILAPVVGTIVDELIGDDILTGDQPTADGPEGTIADTIVGWLTDLF